jgi:hypothetical protein
VRSFFYNKEKLLANGDRAGAGREFGLSAGNAKFLLRDVKGELTIARNECSECGDIRGRWRKKCEDRHIHEKYTRALATHLTT